MLDIPTMAELSAQGKMPEVLLWVGCAGSFDERAKRIVRSFAQLLIKAKVSFAVLGTEEGCTGDPAKRAGNEFLFQMQAMANIETLNSYGITRIVTACPHCFNTLKNEYPALGGNYEVMHHTELLKALIAEGRLTIEGGSFKGKKIVFHDPCYLGRANGVYNAPREVLSTLEADLIEMKRHKARAMCCGAGGAQMFKESERGTGEINVARTEQALEVKADIIATGCPFCHIMMSDGVKAKQKEGQVKVYDVAELLAENNGKESK